MSEDRQLGIWAATLLSPRSEWVGQCAEEICRELIGFGPKAPLAVAGIAFHAGVASLLTHPLKEILAKATDTAIGRESKRSFSDGQFMSPASIEAVISFDCHDGLWDWPLRHFGIKSALFVDDLLPLRAHDTWDQQQAAQYFLRLSRAVECTNLLFCDTAVAASTLATAFPGERDKIRVIAHGIAAPIMRSLESPIGPRGSGSGLVKNSYTVLVVGEMESRDGVCAFLAAIPSIARRIAPARLIVGAVGSAFCFNDENGIAVERLTDKVRRDALVIVSSESNRMLRRFWGDRADAVVLPSPWGDNAVMREALGLGIRVVSSDAPSHLELAGSAAIVFDPYDADDIAKKTVEALTLTQEDWISRRNREAPRLEGMNWRQAASECLSAAKELQQLTRPRSTSLVSNESKQRGSSESLLTSPILTLDSDALREVAPVYNRRPKSHTNLVSPQQRAESWPPEETDRLIAGIFDDILVHGGLAESVAFSECLAGDPSNQVRNTFLEWLGKHARLVEEGTSCFLLTQSVSDCRQAIRAVRSYSMSPATRELQKPRAVVLFREGARTTEDVVSGALCLTNSHSIATMIVSTDSLVVIGDMASPANGGAVQLASALGKRVVVVPNSYEGYSTPDNVFVERSLQSALEITGRPLQKQTHGGSTTCADYPAEWRTIARAIRDRSFGRSIEEICSPKVMSLVVRDDVQAWVASAGIHSRYQREWKQLDHYSRERISSDPIVDRKRERGRWKLGVATTAHRLWHRSLNLRRQKSLRARAMRLVTAADSARDIGDWATASMNYERSLALSPSRADIWVQLGHAQKEQGLLLAATSSYHRALILDDRCADTYVQLAHVLKLQGHLGEAQNAYFAALEREPFQRSASLELESMGWQPYEIKGELRVRAHRPYFQQTNGEDDADTHPFHL